METVNYSKKSTIHNPLYRAWHNMKMRCYNSNVPCYKNYGGRGISVCDEWLKYENFYQDMHKTYKKGLQLDRINNDGNYSLQNCKWSTAKQNTNNTRRSRYIYFNGCKKTVTEWANYLNIKPSTFRQRYYVYNWPLNKLIGDYLGSS
jgi:hypothetical protein